MARLLTSLLLSLLVVLLSLLAPCLARPPGQEDLESTWEALNGGGGGSGVAFEPFVEPVADLPIADTVASAESTQIGVREKASKFKKEGEDKQIDDNEYYQLVEEFLTGVDHYKSLQLRFDQASSINTKAIRKAFRQLSLE